MALIKRRVILLVHEEGGPRDSSSVWGSYDPEDADDYECLKQDLGLAQTKFANHTIKWYVMYEESVNYTDAFISTTILERKAHPEVPPMEFNVKAKGFVPIPQKKVFINKVVGNYIFAQAPDAWDVPPDPEPNW